MFRLLALLSLLLSFSLHAEEIIRNYKVPLFYPSMDKIAANFEVVRKLNDGYEVYVLEEKASEFLKLAPDAVLLEKDIHAHLKALKADKASGFDKYRNYEQVATLLKTWASQYPQFVGLETYGQTAQGHTLYALRLGNPAKGKPELMISSATHGDELIGVEVLLNLIQELIEGQGKEQRLTKMVENHVIYFLPMASPDGFANRVRYVNGKDPNRVFPWPGNPNAKPIDCIESWMKFFDAHNFIGSMDIHAYGKLAMYPWGYTTEAPQTSDAKEMNELVQFMAQENNYEAGQISTTIYVAQGNSADYFYWKKKTRAIAVELTESKIPDPKRIPAVVNEAREMIWRFIEHF